MSAISAISSTSAGLHAAQYQVGVSASTAANAPGGASTPTATAPFGSSAVVATVTGTQPGGVSGNTYNALHTALGTSPGSGASTTAEPTGGTQGPGDPTQQTLSLLSAQQQFQSALTTVQVSNAENNTTVSVVS